MRSSRIVICALPAFLLGACATDAPPPPPAPTAAAAPAVSLPLEGALVAPVPPATTALSGSSMPPAALGETVPLTADETRMLLSNNTAIGLTLRGVPYEIFFASNGTEHFREPLTAAAGRWTIEADGRLCSTLPAFAEGGPNCYQLARDGDVILFQRPDGLALGSVRVVSGNPQAL